MVQDVVDNDPKSGLFSSVTFECEESVACEYNTCFVPEHSLM